MNVTHKETNEAYAVVMNATDKTMGRVGEEVIVYYQVSDPFKLYVREKTEFWEQFNVAEF